MKLFGASKPNNISAIQGLKQMASLDKSHNGTKLSSTNSTAPKYQSLQTVTNKSFAQAEPKLV
ncbi:MAG: hypothetical protein P3M73_00035 [Candidatus Hodgkinia cicadicola]|nr:MAG: hypothetical protein P3M73_00035 [Candidatus Hodgkinia cicadicola]